MRKLHVIDILKVKVFININILKSERINILLSFKSLIINNCEDFIVLIVVVLKNNRIKRLIKVFKNILIFFYISITIFVELRENKISTNKN